MRGLIFSYLAAICFAIQFPFYVLVTDLYVLRFEIPTTPFSFPHLFFIQILCSPWDAKCGILHFCFCAGLVTVYLYIA